MAEKKPYAEGSKPRKADISPNEKYAKEVNKVGKGLAIGLGAAAVGAVAGAIHHTRETMRLQKQHDQKRGARIKVQRPDNFR